LKKKLLRLIKWPKARLENLLGSYCIKRRIRRIAIKDYEIGEHQKPSYSFNDVTYKSIIGTMLKNRRLRIESEDNV